MALETNTLKENIAICPRNVSHENVVSPILCWQAVHLSHANVGFGRYA